MRTAPLVDRISQHALLEGGVPGPRGGSAPGGCLVPGEREGVVSQHVLRQTPPPLWTEFLKHASKNITLPQTSFAGGNNVSGNIGGNSGKKYWAKFC